MRHKGPIKTGPANSGGNSAQNSPRAGEIYFEFIQVGNATKVTAIDADSGVEVSIMGPRTSPQKLLQNQALRKLKKQLEKP